MDTMAKKHIYAILVWIAISILNSLLLGISRILFTARKEIRYGSLGVSSPRPE